MPLASPCIRTRSMLTASRSHRRGSTPVMVEIGNGQSEAAQIRNLGNVAGDAKLHRTVQHQPWFNGVAYRPEVLRDSRRGGVGARRTGELHRNSPLVGQRIPERERG